MTSSSSDRALQDIVDDLARNPRVCGIRLGGSRGLGFADEKSDYDLVLYYRPEDPLSNEDVLRGISMDKSGLKPTTNGKRLSGEMNGLQVEFFYRNMNALKSGLKEVSNTTFTLLPDRWFPQGRLSIEALGYLVNFKLLLDKEGRLKAFTDSALPMPPLFRRTLVEFGIAGAEAALKNMRKARQLPEHTSHVMSHAFLFVWYSEVLIFGINGAYPFSCKQTSNFVSRLPLSPADYLNKVAHIYATAATGQLATASEAMISLLQELRSLSR